VLAVVAIFGTASEALAQFNGARNTFHAEQVANGHDAGEQSLQTASQYSEARTTGGSFPGLILRVWRGLSDDKVWFSFGNYSLANVFLNFNLGTTEDKCNPYSRSPQP
jgi:hypothetical protein